jgi:hypothetical protein
MPPREECRRCGRRIPTRRLGTGFCSDKCERKQHAEDEASREMEREYQDVDDGDYIAARVAERDDLPPSPFD